MASENSATAEAPTQVRVKLLIDSKGKKVLFAEAGKDFIDFLFNILSLPVGTVTRLLTKQGMVGCLGNLYESVENLDKIYIQPNQDKDALLKPMVPNYSATAPLFLLHDAPKSAARTLYKCSYRCNTLSDDNRAVCTCGHGMTTAMTYVSPPTETKAGGAAEGGGFVKGVVTYMVMDDLVVSPMSTISSITILNRFNVKDVGALEEKVVDIGMAEAVKLLKASLETNAVLTSVFLANKYYPSDGDGVGVGVAD